MSGNSRYSAACPCLLVQHISGGRISFLVAFHAPFYKIVVVVEWSCSRHSSGTKDNRKGHGWSCRPDRATSKDSCCIVLLLSCPVPNSICVLFSPRMWQLQYWKILSKFFFLKEFCFSPHLWLEIIEFLNEIKLNILYQLYWSE